MKKSIVIFHPHPDSGGGSLVRARALVELLSEKYRVYILCSAQGKFADELCAVGAEYVKWKVAERSRPVSFVRNMLAFYRFVRSRQVSLVFYHDWSWWKPAEIIAAKFAGIPQLGLVVYKRGSEFIDSYLSHLDVTVCNSTVTEEPLRQGGKLKTEVIPNFVELSSYHHSPPDDTVKTIGYLGMLVEEKGVEILIRAFSEVTSTDPELMLLIAGDEKESGYKRHLEDVAAKLGLSSAVKFVGYQSDIRSFLCGVDIVVIPSLEESFGFVAIEAAAMGKVIVASKSGAFLDIFADGKSARYFEAGNSESLAESILLLSKDFEERKRLSDGAIRRVATTYDKPVVLERWRRLCEEQVQRQTSSVQ